LSQKEEKITRLICCELTVSIDWSLRRKAGKTLLARALLKGQASQARQVWKESIAKPFFEPERFC